jgi:hypothetical protein
VRRVLATLGLGLAVAGCGGTSRPSERPLFGLAERCGQVECSNILVRVDPRTIQPRRPRLRLPDYATTHVFSPDGRTLALGSAGESAIYYVDTVHPRRLRRQTVVPGGMEVEVEAWPSASRLVAVATVTGTWWAPHPSQLLLVDPQDGRVIRRTLLHASVSQAIAGGGGRVALLVERSHPRLVVVEPDGSAWSRVLGRIGLGGRDGTHVSGRYYRPRREAGLAADGQGRVFVAASDRPLAEIDLRTRRVRYHDIELPRRYLSYPPPFVPGSVAPSLRFGTSATWLGRNELAIGGFDNLPASVPGGQIGQREPQRMLQIVDTRRWQRVRSIRAAGCSPVAGIVLCAAATGGLPPDGKGKRGPSLVAYDAGWRRLYEKRSSQLWWGLTGGRLFAGSAEGTRIWELDPRTGVRIRRIRPSPVANEMWPLELFRSRPR